MLAAFAALGGTLLGLRAAGLGVGWGFQFQSPGFVAATAWVLFAVGLNLSGVFAVGGGRRPAPGSSLAARDGHVGSFSTGLLAVLVATPCTAPFMGAAVAGALAAPPVAALAVFLAMGLGLAAPYVLLAWSPASRARCRGQGAGWTWSSRRLPFRCTRAAAWLVWVHEPGSRAAGRARRTSPGWCCSASAAGRWDLAQSGTGAAGGWRRSSLRAAVLATIAVLPGIGAASRLRAHGGGSAAGLSSTAPSRSRPPGSPIAGGNGARCSST